MNQINDNVQEERIDEQSYKNLIVAKIARVKELRAQKKEMKDSLDHIVNVDEEFVKAEGRMLDEKKVMTSRKKELMNTIEANQLLNTKDELTREEKEIKQDLSNLIEVYYSKTGKTEIETDGEALQIIRRFEIKNGQMRLF